MNGKPLLWDRRSFRTWPGSSRLNQPDGLTQGLGLP
jgi:hypothetical protein